MVAYKFCRAVRAGPTGFGRRCAAGNGHRRLTYYSFGRVQPILKILCSAHLGQIISFNLFTQFKLVQTVTKHEDTNSKSLMPFDAVAVATCTKPICSGTHLHPYVPSDGTNQAKTPWLERIRPPENQA